MSARSDLLLSRLRLKHGLKADEKIGLHGIESVRVESFDEAQGDIVVVATTDDVDLEQEVVVPAGASPESYFFRNKKLFIDHDPDVKNCIGSMRSCRPFPSMADHRQWRVRCHIYRNMGNELADFVWKMATTDGIGVSIGFRPLDAGRVTAAEAKQYPGAETIVRAWEWLELSFTAFPCNVACQSIGVMESETRAAKLTDMAVKGAMSPAVAKALGVRLPPPKATTIVLI